ncbi:MAG TPA: hypothetical protein VMT34_06720, partial [Aggregatilineales bacterium]|nr:hypothetical protein [Aggregatilineales bacterium]
MRRLLLIMCLFVLALFPVLLAHADAVPAYNRTAIATVTKAARMGKSSAGGTVGKLEKGERVIIDGRDADGAWWHIRSSVGVGYVEAALLTVVGNTDSIPVVSSSVPAPTMPRGDPASDLALYPILPTVSNFTRSIYQRGKSLGNASDIFTEAGDCMTADNLLFLGQFNTESYDLGA